MTETAEKRLSVIIPGYRTPCDVWRRCIDSILPNLREDDEVICIDDGSPEPSMVLDEMREKDSRISVLKLVENRGQAVARNAGIDKARGKYITFVDSDDAVCTGVYKEAIAELERSAADIVVYGVKVIWRREGFCKADAMDDGYVGEMTPKMLYQMKTAHLFNYQCNKIYSREFLDNAHIRFREGFNPGEDEVLNLECVIARAKWTILRRIGYIYYHGDGSSLSSYKPYNDRSVRGIRDAWRKCREALHDDEGYLTGVGERTDSQIELSNWTNMWRWNTPYSIADRWRWLHKHPELGGVVLFAKTAAFFFARHHLYFRPIRRWHLKKILPEIKEWKPE